jgi:2-polyprenyl-3-methyl-5-hydroxy-6-metoxy-1,4-benzoquinol methylase
MARVPHLRQCWCDADELVPFGDGYARCVSCDTLVRQGGLSDRDLRVVDDARDFYGRRYWLDHQTQDLGLPDIYARARADLPERCVDWLEVLLRYRRPPAKVLEVGAGHGAYTALLGWVGFEATALDLSPWTADFARERFDIRYLVGPVEEQNVEPESFDVVVANDVLEHLAAPKSSLAAWTRLLKPDGLVIFQTPDFVSERSYDDLVAKDDNFLQHMQRAGNEHLYLFSRAAATRLLAELGLCHVAFADATYPYDMLGVASSQALEAVKDDPAAIIGSAPTAPLALALLDARRAWRTSERDRADRLTVIERLDGALRDATAAPPPPRSRLLRLRRGT